MTACCGLAKTFWVFFLARVGVGVGEATLSPCGYSMISDYFPRDKRSKPISLLAMGPYVGGGMSFILGGFGGETGGKQRSAGIAAGGCAAAMANHIYCCRTTRRAGWSAGIVDRQRTGEA